MPSSLPAVRSVTPTECSVCLSSQECSTLEHTAKAEWNAWTAFSRHATRASGTREAEHTDAAVRGRDIDGSSVSRAGHCVLALPSESTRSWVEANADVEGQRTTPTPSNRSPRRSSTMSIGKVETTSTLRVQVSGDVGDGSECRRSTKDRNPESTEDVPSSRCSSAFVRRHDCTNAVAGGTDMDSCRAARSCRQRVDQWRDDPKESSSGQLIPASSPQADRTRILDDANDWSDSQCSFWTIAALFTSLRTFDAAIDQNERLEMTDRLEMRDQSDHHVHEHLSQLETVEMCESHPAAIEIFLRRAMANTTAGHDHAEGFAASFASDADIQDAVEWHRWVDRTNRSCAGMIDVIWWYWQMSEVAEECLHNPFHYPASHTRHHLERSKIVTEMMMEVQWEDMGTPHWSLITINSIVRREMCCLISRLYKRLCVDNVFK